MRWIYSILPAWCKRQLREAIVAEARREHGVAVVRRQNLNRPWPTKAANDNKEGGRAA